MMVVFLQWVSIVAAFGAAFFWLRSALVKIPPGVMGLWDGETMHPPPFLVGLSRAARFNALGALCAAVAAIAQGVAFYLTMPFSN